MLNVNDRLHDCDVSVEPVSVCMFRFAICSQ